LRVEKDMKAGARVEAVVCLQDRRTGEVKCYGGDVRGGVQDKA